MSVTRQAAVAALARGDWQGAVELGLESYLAVFHAAHSAQQGDENVDLLPDCLLLAKAYTHLLDASRGSGGDDGGGMTSGTAFSPRMQAMVRQEGGPGAALAAARQRYLRHARSLAQRQPYESALANAQVYCVLGELYVLGGEYEEAEKMYQLYTTLTEKHFGMDHLATSDCYSLLAAYYTRTGNYPVALVYAGKCLLIRIDRLGLMHLRTADAHYNAGILYRLNGDADEAIKELQYALAAREKLSGADSLPVADTCFSLGVAEQQRQRYAAALQYYERALKLRFQLQGAEHSDTIDIIFHLSALYSETGVLDKAEAEAQTVVLLRQRRHGLRHAATGDALLNLGYISKKLGKFSEAEACFRGAGEAFEAALGPEHAKNKEVSEALKLL